ncbi:MAG: UvrD-helicase domain-containing protein [Candidatus Falkowbacteria bacterium]
MNNLLENLNPEQLKAVMHKNGPLLIVAGAGTGKTMAISQRIAYLMEQGKARPEEILALTFTEKAAGEMEERVDRLLPMGYLDLWISTFHGFGEKILSEHGLDIGLPGGGKLLNEFEQWALMKKNLDKFNLDYYRPMGNPTKFIHALIKHFSRCKDENISPAEYLEYAVELRQNLDSMLGGGKGKKRGNFQTDNKDIAEQETKRINEIANAYHIYNQLLLDNNALDFGDLINYSLKLFRERPAILEKYRTQFKYILVDEFQDTNLAQYELIKLLAAPKNNLVVVGDDDQAIYRFRGASMSNILQFKRDFPDATQVFLKRNYRNCQSILDLSYGFIKLNDPNRLEYELNRDIKGPSVLTKKLEAQNPGAGTIEVITGEDIGDEINRIIAKIIELKNSDPDGSWNDFAVLVRANEGAREISAALEAASLPYQLVSSRGLYTKDAVMDVIAYLRLLDNYHESPAVYRVINMPIFGFSYQEIVNFNYFARKKARSLYEVIKSFPGVNAALKAKIDRLLELISAHTKIARYKSVSDVIISFINDSGYLKELTEKDGERIREVVGYLNQFLKRAKAFEAGSDDKRVKAFLSELELEMEAGESGSIPFDPDAGPEAIRVMTVHAAKGLEFKYVFLANMVDQRFPTVERKEPIPIPDALVREKTPAGDIHTEEERRLFYVAVTRARNNIYFTWAPDYGGARKKKPSKFLIEAGLITAPEKEEKRSSAADIPTIGGQDLNVKTDNTGKSKTEIKLPGYFSHTQLTAFKNCPYQYYLAHIVKVPTRGKYVFSFGQAMHLTLQRLFELIREKRGLGQGDLFGAKAGAKSEEMIGLEEIYDIYDKAWIDDWYESKEEKEKYRQKGRDILKEFFFKHKDKWPKIVSLEQGVNLKIGGFRIFGKIDRIDDCGDGSIQIVDYKTGRPKEEEAIGPEEKEQLLIYQLAARQAIEAKVKNLQFYYLDDNSEVNFIGTEKEMAKMEEKILDRINGIKEAAATGIFPPNPTVMCKFCDFYGICEFRK